LAVGLLSSWLVQEYTLRTILVLVASVLAIGTAWAREGEQVKKNVKDAGEATDHAARKTGRKIQRTIKKAVHKSSEKVAEGAEKAKRKISA
jgi:hypothetical protein